MGKAAARALGIEQGAMSIEEAAAWLGVPPAAFSALIKAGLAPAAKFPGCRTLVGRTAIDRWLTEQISA
jgi:excisionase family DNA binding protein